MVEKTEEHPDRFGDPLIIDGRPVPPNQDYVLLHDHRVGVIMGVDRDGDGDRFMRVVMEDFERHDLFSGTTTVKAVILRDHSETTVAEYLARPAAA